MQEEPAPYCTVRNQHASAAQPSRGAPPNPPESVTRPGRGKVQPSPIVWPLPLPTPIAFRTPSNLQHAARTAAVRASSVRARAEKSWRLYNCGNANYAGECSHRHRQSCATKPIRYGSFLTASRSIISAIPFPWPQPGHTDDRDHPFRLIARVSRRRRVCSHKTRSDRATQVRRPCRWRAHGLRGVASALRPASDRPERISRWVSLCARRGRCRRAQQRAYGRRSLGDRGGGRGSASKPKGLHRAIVWVIISQFRSAAFCCC
jgi:hypothetical protein